ncbi:ABC transporter substrate-binding protein [Ralstonia syzygii]|uniref:Putative leu/ile/val-binding protein n=1 Tax=Ralstonia syzygii R24 TaxID=907261 RepID=G3A7I0_9RALS|nr:ABC transporter substrate-binding protein [Ralstonia syzygii]CCA86453.1 putative leu/ile/val-binding protein [Ralstonia syzygii R24]
MIQLLGRAIALSMLMVVAHSAAASESTPIRIGMTSAVTGPYNEYGEGNKRGVELAVAEWNARGGVNGHRVELAIVLDDQLIPDRAVQNMRKLLDDKSLVGFIGPAGSGPALAVVAMAAADGRPFMNPVAQSPTVTYPNGGAPTPNVFTFALQNDVEARVLAGYVSKRFKKIGLIHESTAYGVSGADLVAKELQGGHGGQVVATESYNQRTQDMTAQLAKLQRSGADVIVCIGLGADLAMLRRNMARMNMPIPLLASNGALSLPYQEAAGDLVVGTRGTMIRTFGESELNPAAAALANAYKAKYGPDRWWGADSTRPQIFMSLSVANAYDAANVLFEGIRRANSTEPHAIINAIEGIQNLRGVNAVYSFSPKRHHAIVERDVAVYEYVKASAKPRLQIIKD